MNDQSPDKMTGRLKEWLRQQLAPTMAPVDRIEVLESSEETRLRFNSPTPVSMFTVRVWCVGGAMAVVDAGYWQIDDEWELLNVADENVSLT